jgi:antitoxin component HigA of HigAB toxin-antitoxin module
MAIKTKNSGNPVDIYLDLITNLYPLRPIHNAGEHRRAKQALRSLVGDKRKDAIDYKKVLVGLVETYEREQNLQLDTRGVSAADVVQHLLDERGLSVNAFAKERGISQSALSDMLNGKREWSKSAIANVAGFFGLNYSLFFQ